MLAISLHAVRDELRDELVPINRKYPIADLLAGLPRLSRAVERAAHYLRICHAERRERFRRRGEGIGRLLPGIPAKINLIPFNPWPGAPYECSDWAQIERFADIVNRRGLCEPDQDAARTGHHGGVRSIEIGEREGQGERGSRRGGGGLTHIRGE